MIAHYGVDYVVGVDNDYSIMVDKIVEEVLLHVSIKIAENHYYTFVFNYANYDFVIVPLVPYFAKLFHMNSYEVHVEIAYLHVDEIISNYDSHYVNHHFFRDLILQEKRVLKVILIV